MKNPRALTWQSQAIVNFLNEPKTFDEVLNTFSYSYKTKTLVRERIDRLVKQNLIRYIDRIEISQDKIASRYWLLVAARGRMPTESVIS